MIQFFRILPLLCSLPTLAGTAYATPPPFSQRAPKDTRLLIHLDLSDMHALLPIPNEARLQMSALLTRCGIDLATDLGTVDIAFARDRRYRAEISGKADSTKLGCAFGDPGDFRPVGARVSRSDSGLVVDAAADGARGLPAMLAALIRAVPPLSKVTVAFQAGPPSTPTAFVLWYDGAKSGVRVRFPDERAAVLGRGQIEHALTQIEKQGMAVRQDLTVAPTALEVSIETTNFGSLRLLLAAALLEAFNVNFGGMAPTLRKGDHFYTVKGPLIGAIKRGDIVSFWCPTNPKAICMGRVLAIGGDEFEIDGATYRLNGKPLRQIKEGVETFTSEEGKSEKLDLVRETLDGTDHLILRRAEASTRKVHSSVPLGSLFVVGDNRDHSYDSRDYGPVSASAVAGRATIIWWSDRWQRVGELK